jgi:hypothetical protein
MSDRIYRVFSRTWWKDNPSWLNGLEPCPGRKRFLKGKFTLEDARRMCARLNAEPVTARQERLGFKWEFTS